MSWDCEEYDVIVIGCGMAGLGAARAFINEGVKFLVVEGRDRPGGRVYTERLPPINGLESMDVDMGANYLIGCQNKHSEQPLLGLTKEAEVETVTCAGDLIRKFGGWECPEVAMWKDYKTGEDIPMEVVVSMSHLYDMTVSMMSARYKKMNKVKKKLWNLKDAFFNSRKSLLKLYFEHGFRTSPELSQIELEVFDSISSRLITYQSPLEQLPMAVVHDMATLRSAEVGDGKNRTQVFEVMPLGQEDVNEWINMIFHRLKAIKEYPPTVTSKVLNKYEDRLVTNRFSNFVDLLKKNVPIRYNCIVKKLDYREYDSVILHCLDSKTKTVTLLKCRHCICTVPVGVLANLDTKASIEFVPPLPNAKVEAIRRLALPHKGAETHNKIVLRYHPDDVFWHSNAPHLKTNHNLVHILNFHCYGKPGLLVCHVWGGTGIKTVDYTDSDLVNMVLDILEGMYQKRASVYNNGKLPKPIQTRVTRWSEDPFSLGSYTPGGKDSSNADRREYRNSLFSPYFSNMLSSAATTPSSSTSSIPSSKLGLFDSSSNGDQKFPSVLFAGEGTLDDSEAKECTHGALLSGVNRAADLIDWRLPRRKVALDNPVAYLKRKLITIPEEEDDTPSPPAPKKPQKIHHKGL